MRIVAFLFKCKMIMQAHSAHGQVLDKVGNIIDVSIRCLGVNGKQIAEKSTKKMVEFLNDTYHLIQEIGCTFESLESEYPKFEYTFDFKRERYITANELRQAHHEYGDHVAFGIIINRFIQAEHNRESIKIVIWKPRHLRLPSGY